MAKPGSDLKLNPGPETVFSLESANGHFAENGPDFRRISSRSPFGARIPPFPCYESVSRGVDLGRGPSLHLNKQKLLGRTALWHGSIFGGAKTKSEPQHQHVDDAQRLLLVAFCRTSVGQRRLGVHPKQAEAEAEAEASDCFSSPRRERVNLDM